jgi:hypothetical protein
MEQQPRSPTCKHATLCFGRFMRDWPAALLASRQLQANGVYLCAIQRCCFLLLGHCWNPGAQRRYRRDPSLSRQRTTPGLQTPALQPPADGAGAAGWAGLWARAIDYAATLPLLAFVPDSLALSPERSTLEVAGQSVLSVRGLLSSHECDAVVQEAAKDGRMEAVNWEYVATYRRCTRSVTSSPTLATTILERLRPLLMMEDLDGVQPYGIGTDGHWVLAHVNPCMRVSCYEAGSGFLKHRDNGFVFSDELRSIFTVVIYLNDGFSGGQTAFYSDNERVAVAPVKGSATVFTHDCMHEGATVESGIKWVLRTDIMFQRIERIESLRFAYLDDARYQRAEALYQQSIALQKAGDPATSTGCFREAMEIHAQLSSLRAQKRAEPDVSLRTVLSKDVWIDIALRLRLQECVALSQINSYFKLFIRSSSALWQAWFGQRWGPDAHLVMRICSQLGDTTTYYAAFRARFLASKSFVVRSVDLTSNLCVSVKGEDVRIFSGRCGNSRGHLWHSGSAMFNCAIGVSVLMCLLDCLSSGLISVQKDEFEQRMSGEQGARPAFFAVEKPYWSAEEHRAKIAAFAAGTDFPLGQGCDNCASQFIRKVIHDCSPFFKGQKSYLGLKVSPDTAPQSGRVGVMACAMVCCHVRKRKREPLLAVVAPQAMAEAEALYRALHQIVPMLPYALVCSVSPLLCISLGLDLHCSQRLLDFRLASR